MAQQIKGGFNVKKYSIVLLAATCAVTLIACGRDKIISTGNQKISNAVYDDETISLAPYTGLTAVKNNYKVTEDALNRAIHEQLSDYINYKTVERPSKDGDVIETDYTISIDDKTYDEDSEYNFTIGQQEYGKEFDQKLIGVSAGDELNFSLNYDKNYSDVDFAGNTANFKIKINKVQEEILPDTTDAFIKEHFDYDTYDAFEKATRKSLEDEYKEESSNELSEELLQQIIKASSILQYTQGEYDDAYKEAENVYASYADMLGTDIESIYDSFEVTKDSLKKEALDNLSRTMVINAIIKNERLTLSDEEYETGISDYMKINDYDSKKDFLNEFGEDEIRQQLLEDKAVNFIVENADITEVDAEYDNS